MNLLNTIFSWAAGIWTEKDVATEQFSLREVFEQLEEELKAHLARKNIALEYDRFMSVVLRSNKGIVTILLRNLIINAIKFSYDGTIVSLRAYQEDGMWIVAVQDKGVGMSEETIKGLFAMQMNSTNGTKGEKGNGLGIALCLDLIKSLDGKIEVESEVGRGTIFKLFFPDKRHK